MQKHTANNPIAFIICGALAREVLAIVQKHGWGADVICIPASDHMFPQRIAPHVEQHILNLRDQYERLIVVLGDCGSRGALDDVLEKHNLERIAGPHCYEMYGGAQFQSWMEEEPGTFFLTDFLVRAFQGTVVKGLGLDRFPDLHEVYFGNYQRVIYLAQDPSPELEAKARQVAAYLKLPLEIRPTGYGLLETRLLELMEKQHESAGRNS